MVAPELVRGTSHGVTLLGDPCRPCGVTLAFTERTGGVSTGCFSSLNLGNGFGDTQDAVRENRNRALLAIGARAYSDSLIALNQVHGTNVVVVGESGIGVEDARAAALEGADAIVCTAYDIPALICVADCVSIALVTNGAFALVHSGWRGTLLRIAKKALGILLDASGSDPRDVRAYVGPHIGPRDYEVSSEIAHRFLDEFGDHVLVGERNLDLGAAVTATLVESGIARESIACVEESTASHTDRFFSYRAQGGECGRMGLIACMHSGPVDYSIAWDR